MKSGPDQNDSNRNTDDLRDSALAALYRESAREEAPAAQHATVLQAAMRALAAEQAARKPPLWKRLRIPVAVAATAAFATVLSVLVEREQSLNAPAPAPAPASAPTQDNAAAKPVVPGSQSSADEQPRAEAKHKSAAEEPHTTSNSGAPSSAPAPRPYAAPGESAPSVADAPAAPDMAASPPPPAAPQSFSPKPEAQTGNLEQHKQAGADAAPAAQAERERALGSPQQALRRTAPAAPSAEQQNAQGQISGTLSKAFAVARDAPSWIDEITRLLDEGKTEQARTALREFRRAYPDFTLPGKLAELEAQP